MKEIKPNTHSLTVPITNISLTEQILYKTVTYCKKGCPWPKCECKFIQTIHYWACNIKIMLLLLTAQSRHTYKWMAWLRDLMLKQCVSDKVCLEVVVRYMMNCWGAPATNVMAECVVLLLHTEEGCGSVLFQRLAEVSCGPPQFLLANHKVLLQFSPWPILSGSCNFIIYQPS
jgi:hypothetical protein